MPISSANPIARAVGLRMKLATGSRSGTMPETAEVRFGNVTATVWEPARTGTCNSRWASASDLSR
jgi:hypothetical protein